MPDASEFDADTAVEPDGDGRYTTTISGRWSIGEAPNGGYLLAIAVRALAAALPHPDPLTVTGHFLSSPRPGPACIEVATLRVGRTLARGEVRLLQGDTECLRALAAFGRLPSGDPAPTLQDGAAPELPPPDACVRVRATTPDGRDAPLRDRLDIRYHPDSVGWARSSPTGRARISAWVRPADGREPDAILSTLLVDALPSAVFDLGLRGWIPTMELTVHHRARPVPGWLRCTFGSRFATHGLVEEDGEIWDETGELVAMSRQLSLLPGSVTRATSKTDGQR